LVKILEVSKPDLIVNEIQARRSSPDRKTSRQIPPPCNCHKDGVRSEIKAKSAKIVNFLTHVEEFY